MIFPPPTITHNSTENTMWLKPTVAVNLCVAPVTTVAFLVNYQLVLLAKLMTNMVNPWEQFLTPSSPPSWPPPPPPPLMSLHTVHYINPSGLIQPKPTPPPPPTLTYNPIWKENTTAHIAPIYYVSMQTSRGTGKGLFILIPVYFVLMLMSQLFIFLFMATQCTYQFLCCTQITGGSFHKCLVSIFNLARIVSNSTVWFSLYCLILYKTIRCTIDLTFCIPLKS